MSGRVSFSMCVLLAAAAAAAGDQLVRGQGGEYSLRLPAGWKMQLDGSGVEAFGGRVWMKLRFVEMQMSLRSSMGSVVAGTQKIWKGVTREDGSATIGGNSASVCTLRGADEKGTRMVRRVAMFNPIPPDPGRHTYVFLFDVAERDYQWALPEILQIEQSFRVGSGDAVPPAAPQPAAPPPGPPPTTPPPPEPAATGADSSIYRDPRGRFQIPVPPDWTSDASDEGVRISRGSTYANVIVVEGGPPPSALIQQLSRQIGGQWKDFRMVQSGQWTLGGMPSEYAVFTGVNPRGVPAVMRIVAAPGFVLLMSVPQNDWEPFKADLQRMEMGFSTGRSGGASPAGRASLGVACRDVNTGDMWQSAGGVKEGAIVDEIGPGSPAERAGFRVGDIIVAMDRKPVRGVKDLAQLMMAHQPGDMVHIVVLRGGKPLEFILNLAGRP